MSKIMPNTDTSDRISSMKNSLHSDIKRSKCGIPMCRLIIMVALCMGHSTAMVSGGAFGAASWLYKSPQAGH